MCMNSSRYNDFIIDILKTEHRSNWWRPLLEYCDLQTRWNIIFISQTFYSAEEAGRYLETFKAYEHKPPDLIMEKTESNFLSQVAKLCF